MSKPDWCELLAVVEVDLDIETEDAVEEATHVELRAFTEMMPKANMVLPVYTASLTSNGVGCLYVFEQRDSGEGHRCSAHTGAASSPSDSLLADRRRRPDC